MARLTASVAGTGQDLSLCHVLYQGKYRKLHSEVCILYDGHRARFSQKEQVQCQSLAQHPLDSPNLFHHFKLTMGLFL